MLIDCRRLTTRYHPGLNSKCNGDPTLAFFSQFFFPVRRDLNSALPNVTILLLSRWRGDRRCDAGDDDDYNGRAGEQAADGSGYLASPEGFHNPCCGNQNQGFHRDLDWEGSMTVTIPLKPQRKDYGIVRFCFDNSTGQGTHIAPRPSAQAHRTYDRQHELVYRPGGWAEHPGKWLAIANDMRPGVRMRACDKVDTVNLCVTLGVPHRTSGSGRPCPLLPRVK